MMFLANSSGDVWTVGSGIIAGVALNTLWSSATRIMYHPKCYSLQYLLPYEYAPAHSYAHKHPHHHAHPHAQPDPGVSADLTAISRAASATGVAILQGTTNVGNSCDSCSTTITLPFTISLYNRSFTSASVNSNGIMQLGYSDWVAPGCLPISNLDVRISSVLGTVPH